MSVSGLNKTLLLIALGCCTKFGSAQVPVQGVNLRYLDSFENDLKLHFCKGITYPDKYSKKKIDYDQSIVVFLNTVFQPNFTAGNLSDALNSIREARVFQDRKENGLIRLHRITINGTYIRADLEIESIDSLIFRKKVLLTTNTHGHCIGGEISVLDYQLIRRMFLKEIYFPVVVTYNALSANSSYPKNLMLAANKHPDYFFELPAPSHEDWINTLLLHPFNNDYSCCYSYTQGNPEFVNLIKSNKTEIIIDLLYSPNYFYSVEAMEALIYLDSQKKIAMDDKMRERFALIRQNHSPITIQKTEDLFTTVNGYKEIGISEKQVVRKYENSLGKTQ